MSNLLFLTCAKQQVVRKSDVGLRHKKSVSQRETREICLSATLAHHYPSAIHKLLALTVDNFSIVLLG